MDDLEKSGRTAERRGLELSFTQVAASALAAVAGAMLASQLGVYGTILGAAVVSAGATTGGAVFQHLFRRTGEQFRELSSGAAPLARARVAEEPVAAEKARVFDPFDPGGERTRMMAQISPPEPAEAVAVYRGRNTWRPRSWKVYAVTATIVFALAMGTIGVIELVAGQPAGRLFDSGRDQRQPSGKVSVPVGPSAGSGAPRSGGQPDGGAASGGGTSTAAVSPSAAPSGAGSPGGDPTPRPGVPSSDSPGTGTGTGDASGSGTGAGSGSGSGAGASVGAGPGARAGTSGAAATPNGAASP
jgi:hypothetical protein